MKIIDFQVGLVKPITEFPCWPVTFYVLTETHVSETENLIITNEELDNHLIAHFKRAAEVTYVTVRNFLFSI